MLTSALFFKGQWEHPFDPTYTKPQTFKALTPQNPGTPTEIQVDMMSKTFEPSEQRVLYSEVPDRYRALQLPYKGSSSGISSGLVTIFVLPSEGISIQEAGQILVAPDAWSPLTQRLAVSLPRFKLEVKQLSLTNVSM
jgi:serine protease inhibitor